MILPHLKHVLDVIEASTAEKSIGDKVTCDPEVDVLRILFSSGPIEESDKEKPGIILDYDRDGNVVGMEILEASKRTENPRAVEYAVTGQARCSIRVDSLIPAP